MVEPLGGIAFVWPYPVALLVGYLFGSLPTGLFITRFAGLGDIRAIGSGNIGATNVLRTGRKDLAALTLLIDLLKGALPVWLAWRLGQDMAVLAALGAVLGHCFPVWLGFKGGKAVATAAGAIIMLSWPVGLAAFAVWLITALIWRMASLAALVASLAGPAIAWFFANQPIGDRYFADVQRFQMIAVIGLIVIWRHHANIRRLLAGQEPKIGASKPDPKQ